MFKGVKNLLGNLNVPIESNIDNENRKRLWETIVQLYSKVTVEYEWIFSFEIPNGFSMNTKEITGFNQRSRWLPRYGRIFIIPDRKWCVCVQSNRVIKNVSCLELVIPNLFPSERLGIPNQSFPIQKSGSCISI